MSKFFRWCVSRDYIATSPCDGVEPPTRTNKRDRVLDGSEISAVWNAAAAVGYPFGPIVQLLLLTAQRRNEVAHLQWDHLDLTAGKWVIPATLTKNGEQQNLPLSPAVIAILENAPRMHDRFIFPARGNDETCFSGFGKCKARLDAMINIPNWTLHDLRRTAATGMAGLGVSPHVVERILNHTGGTLGGVAGIYNRFNYQDEMRDALDRWATRLTASKM